MEISYQYFKREFEKDISFNRSTTLTIINLLNLSRFIRLCKFKN